MQRQVVVVRSDGTAAYGSTVVAAGARGRADNIFYGKSATLRRGGGGSLAAAAAALDVATAAAASYHIDYFPGHISCRPMS